MFSIIVPVYKVEKYLDKCVQSLIGQTYPNIEIILVDDGSPDRCPEMCDAYAAQDSRIKVIHKTNGGQSEARNFAMEVATGQYIVFVDSDDYIDLNACESLVPATEHDCDIIVIDGICEGGHKNVVHRVCQPERVFSGQEYLKAAYGTKAMPMAAGLYVYKRAFLLEKQLWYKVGVVHEDDHFIARAFLLAQSVIDPGIAYYHYLIAEGSTTTRKDLRKNARDLDGICAELRDIFDDLSDRELKRYLIDSLSVKQLSLSQDGKLYQYGNAFLYKRNIWKNACRLKTRAKAAFFCTSPWLYWHVNHLSKTLLKRKA